MKSHAPRQAVIGRARRKAAAWLRFGAALALIFHIAHTPFHLHSVRHAEDLSGGATVGWSVGLAFTNDPGQDGTGHAEHPAAQHKFKALRTERAAVAGFIAMPFATWMNRPPAYRPPKLPEFAGLSPPEFACAWQFLFRAALPVRAPSRLS